MAIKTTATRPRTEIRAIFHFFALVILLPPFWPILQYYFTKNREEICDLTIKEKEGENTYSQTSFHLFTFNILSTNDWVFGQS